MRVYAHRGNLSGKDEKNENHPNYLKTALEKGYCVEIDVWYMDGKLYAGHDSPRYWIDREFLIDDRVLVHAKNVEAFNYLTKFSNIHSFYQNSEHVVLTTWGYRLWHQDTLRVNIGEATQKDIIVDLDFTQDLSGNPYGIIVDNPTVYPDFKEQQSCFKLLILDVDGVLTNGRKSYNSDHEVVAKEFCDRDFTAIKHFKSAGIPVYLLSGDNFNLGMSKSRGIPFENARNYSDQLDKSIAMEVIAKRFKISLEDIAYVGDDYYDLSALNIVGYPYCPQNAAEIVKKYATVIPRDGGDGVIEALFESRKEIRRNFPYE